MGAVPSQLVEGKDNTDPKMKAFVAVFAGIAAANAAPKADPWLLAHPFYLGDAHTQTSSDLVEYPNGAKVPDNTLSVKAAGADHLLVKALQTPWWHPIGKREAEAEADPHLGLYGYGFAPYGYGVAPVVEGKDTGLIFSKGSGAITPAFTDAQVEADPKIAEGSESIQVPVVTGFKHYIRKREAEAEADPYFGLYGGYYGGSPLVLHWDGAVTPDYTPEVKAAALAHFEANGYPVYGYGKRSAEADPYFGLYGGYGGFYGAYPYAVAPVIKPKDSGLIFTASSGAVTPDFTAEQKETNPEIAEGSESIKVPAWTGEYHVLGKREAKPYYGLGYGYGGYGLGYGGYAYWG